MSDAAGKVASRSSRNAVALFSLGTMSLPEFPAGASRVVAGRYPPPGTDIHADAIRERRGARGITPLDANLLHVPPVAGGFNALLGAVRTKGSLPGYLRELMVSD